MDYKGGLGFVTKHKSLRKKNRNVCSLKNKLSFKGGECKTTHKMYEYLPSLYVDGGETKDTRSVCDGCKSNFNLMCVQKAD